MGMPLSELKGFCEYLIKKKNEGAPILNSERYFKYFLDGKPGYKCHLPKLAVCVDGRGYVEDCLDMKHPIGNVREMKLKDIMKLPQYKSLSARAEECCTCNSPTMIDLSNVWENPQILFEDGGIQIG
jgi:MoaA/NifB/PqqE/SkfB family radical SAM enzyme